MLPQGTIPRGKAFFDPVLRGKTGAARLAARTGAQVVPVALWNTEAIWPRSARLPKITNVLNPPLVTVRVGPVIHDLGLGPADAVADTERIMEAISALLPPEAHERREPSEEELASTYPKGKIGEERAVGVSPRAEPSRERPGKPSGGARKRSASSKRPSTAKKAATGTDSS